MLHLVVGELAMALSPVANAAAGFIIPSLVTVLHHESELWAWVNQLENNDPPSPPTYEERLQVQENVRPIPISAGELWIRALLWNVCQLANRFVQDERNFQAQSAVWSGLSWTFPPSRETFGLVAVDGPRTSAVLMNEPGLADRVLDELQGIFDTEHMVVNLSLSSQRNPQVHWLNDEEVPDDRLGLRIKRVLLQVR